MLSCLNSLVAFKMFFSYYFVIYVYLFRLKIYISIEAITLKHKLAYQHYNYNNILHPYLASKINVCNT